jgi:sugar/nucleoside kinase (ribokinase family)
MQAPVPASGGSVANTIAGLAALGATAGFLGKTGNDRLGDFFKQDLLKRNVR